ncbi:hypothetical protein DPMN_116829 [Dreissena polymorpha]|uniref:Uncharacterized protein n=1 Tax=Dreissena polymorpha TaxID=45954 RepID=A0A9D4QV39_DREPO|nr:hypothetical protein DPMN_116829 [Dreissena polymorpha]
MSRKLLRILYMELKTNEYVRNMTATVVGQRSTRAPTCDRQTKKAGLVCTCHQAQLSVQ